MSRSRQAIALAVIIFGSWQAIASAEPGDGALLRFEVSGAAVPHDGRTQRSGLQGAALVAFGEKFAIQSSSMRLELTPSEPASASTSVLVRLYDLQHEPAVLVGTERLSMPAASGTGAVRIQGADGAGYSVSVQYSPAKLPAGKS